VIFGLRSWHAEQEARRPEWVPRCVHARAPTELSVTWAQALAWRLQRHLLDPVASESVGGVLRRLGAVLSMDE
jgi:hypothetical protein